MTSAIFPSSNPSNPGCSARLGCACATLILLAGGLGLSPARAANETLLNNDASSSTSFTGSTNWSNNAIPNGVNDYSTAGFLLRTPADANNYTFAGKSLTLTVPVSFANGDFIYKGTAANNTYTINNLTNNGGLIRSGAGSGNICTIGGNMAVTGNSTIEADQSAFVISANLSGGAVLTNLNPGPQTYGTVTYSGNNSAFTGGLFLGANAIVIFGNKNSAPGNPAAPNPGQITLSAGSTLQDNAGITLTSANGGITLAGNATLNIPTASVATTLGVPISGGSGLVKTGAGALYLDASNSLTGTITVSNGMVAGVGSLGGPVVVGLTGSLGAGDAGATVGTLTINDDLTLQGNTTLRINDTGGSPTNDLVVVAGDMNYGGVLTVSNITSDGTLLTTNSSFQLFNVTGAPAGNFRTIAGSPGASLAYVFNPANGVLSVVTAASLDAQLAHRYSFFNEPNGSLTATDSIAGANGTLQGGAAISGGKLALNGASGSYANLPGGIITGDTAVTIEAWADYGSLPANCYLFSFGNTDGANGANYIFCAPQAARITISGTDPGDTSGAEQNASTSGWSGKTNLHVVAVFDPPAGYLAIYTNGFPAGSNNAVTTSLGAVNDVLSYIGKSLYTSDPYAPINVSEFRIWNGALSTAQIALDAAAGPTQIVTDPGPLQAIHLSLATQMSVNGSAQVYNLAPGGFIASAASLLANGTQQAVVMGDFTNLTGVNLAGYLQPTFASSNTSVLTVNGSGVVTAVGAGTTTISVSYGGLTATQSVTAVQATNRFVFDSFGDGFWNLINQANGNALVVSASGATQAIPTNGTTQQQYEMLYNIQSNTFRIRQESSWLCIGSANGAKTVGAGVTTISYSSQASQQWSLQDAGGGYFRIVNVAANLMLQTDNGSPAIVTLAQSNATANQLWKFVYQGHYPKKGTAGYENDYSPFELNWAYNYDDHTGTSLPAQVNFAPMIHDASWEPISDVTSRSTGWRSQAGPNYLMTYNEPDNASQANMTVPQTIGLWPSLQTLNVPLVGPGTQNVEDTWENSFYTSIAQDNYRVDYSAVHDYVPPNAGSLISNCKSVYNKYGRGVWLTEFSPVDWNGNQGWTEDDDYNFLAEFMWQAEDQDWLKRYSIFPFTGTNALPPYQSTTAGYRGNYFLTGSTLSPYGELYATWDADRTLHARIPYILHNLATSFRLTATNGVGTPLANTIYVRNATTEFALLAAPTTNHWYIISLNDGRRLSDIGGTLGWLAVGVTGPTVEWTFTGPDSSGYYFIGNAAGGHNINGSGTAPAISFTTVSSATQNNNTRWRLVKPYTPPAIAAAMVPSNPGAVGLNHIVSLNWTAGSRYYNVYRGTNQGGPYGRLASALTSPSYVDNSATNNGAYYYVVTGMSILGEESANSIEVSATPTVANGWRAQWFGSTANTGSAANNADPDGDGIVNLLERAFNLNPTAADTNGAPTGALNGNTFTLTYRKSVAATDLSFQVVASPDLSQWTANNITDTIVSSDGVTEIHAASIPVTNTTQFLQLLVTPQ